jgi:hypothetical protein
MEAEDVDTVAPQERCIITVPARDENSSIVKKIPSEVNESAALAIEMDSSSPIVGGIGQPVSSDQIKTTTGCL